MKTLVTIALTVFLIATLGAQVRPTPQVQRRPAPAPRKEPPPKTAPASPDEAKEQPKDAQPKQAEPPKTAAATPAASATASDAGAMLFRKNGCYECHSNDAQGGPQGPRLGPNPVPLPRFLAYVRNPTGDMPPFTATIVPDADLQAIYAFLQSRPVPPPVASIPLLAP